MPKGKVIMSKSNCKGKLEVVCGSMFSGKSEELIRRLRRAELAQLKTSVFKHKLDDRMTIEHIHAHSGERLKAIALDNPQDMHLFVTDEVQVVGIDEVQFFPTNIINIILQFVEAGKRVIVAGLDLDFRGMPFGCMPTLMAIADCVTKLNAVCMKCGEDAHYTQRLINGKAARFDDPIIMTGAQEYYQARCRSCYIIDKPMWQSLQNLQNNI